MFQHVFVAGTFDGLHKGHEAILTRAFTEGERVTVGITPDALVRKMKNVEVAPFEERKRKLIDWLTHKGWMGKTRIIAITDKYEPAASDPQLDALVVSPQNKKTGEEINDIRNTRGLKALALLEVPLVAAQDRRPISSTRMRSGEIDSFGKLILPDALRPELAKPLGTLLTDPAIGELLGKLHGRIAITVGDVVTKTFLDAGITPSIAIIDLRVGRKPARELADFSQKGKHVTSGPGFIAKEAIAAIGTWAEHMDKNPSHKEVLVIDGEEDLLVLPAILAAPLEALVYYGQPEKGVVEVKVTIEKKKEMAELFRKFTQQ